MIAIAINSFKIEIASVQPQTSGSFFIAYLSFLPRLFCHSCLSLVIPAKAGIHFLFFPGSWMSYFIEPTAVKCLQD